MPTIAGEERANPVLTLDEARYVTSLLGGLDVYPAYYARMGRANTFGADAPALLPPPRVLPGHVPGRVAAGDWVADLRDRRAFAAGHVPGSLNFPLGGAFATHLGWLLPEGARLTLLGETPCQVAAAQRELARIGVDRIAGAAIGTLADWLGGEDPARCPVSDFRGLAAARRRGGLTIVDVRRPLEWAASHIEGAVHIPLHELPGRLRELPPQLPGRGPVPVWVHCQAGYRAAHRRLVPGGGRAPGDNRGRRLCPGGRGRAAAHRPDRPGRARGLPVIFEVFSRRRRRPAGRTGPGRWRPAGHRAAPGHRAPRSAPRPA